MAAPKAKDPLDALEHLINDVLVQTGKALRASRRDAQGNLVQPPGTIQSKLPDTIQAFHSALDELESDIVRAKSVLLRDLNQLQSNKNGINGQSLQHPQPIESQSKSPMNIDLESSPPSAPAQPSPRKQVAPVPDMEMDLSKDTSAKTGPALKNEEQPTKPETRAPVAGMSQPGGAAVKAEASAVADEPSSLVNSNFTDMQFSLAPTANDMVATGTDQIDASNTSAFDITSFAPNDGSANNVVSLDSLESSTRQMTAKPETTNAEAKPEEGKKENSAKFEDIFGNDASQADGMDFDFSLGGGGTGDDTFDDLMNDRDGTFEMMNNEDFDAAFFGLDNTNAES